MSNEGYSDQPWESQQPQSNNPWENQQSQNNNPFASSNEPQATTSYSGNQGGYEAPSGPPPGPQPRRTDTFKETDFIPESERGEQREAMQQFELNKDGNESKQERDVAMLQQEFPGIDASLVAAIYGDSHDTGATRETLQELSSPSQGGQGQ